MILYGKQIVQIHELTFPNVLIVGSLADGTIVKVCDDAPKTDVEHIPVAPVGDSLHVPKDCLDEEEYRQCAEPDESNTLGTVPLWNVRPAIDHDGDEQKDIGRWSMKPNEVKTNLRVTSRASVHCVQRRLMVR